jgi:hypothetical protein
MNIDNINYIVLNALEDIKIRMIGQELRPLQLVFFEGDDPISDTLEFIQVLKTGFAKKTKFYDIGILLNRDILSILKQVDEKRNIANSLPIDTKHLYVWKCGITIPDVGLDTYLPFITEMKIADAITGKKINSGPVIKNLEDMIKVGKCSIYSAKYIKTKNPMNKYKISDIRSLIERLYKKYNSSKLDLNPIRLLTMLFPFTYYPISNSKCGNCVKDDSDLISSELITIILNELKLTNKIPKNTFAIDILSLSGEEDIIEEPFLIKL